MNDQVIINAIKELIEIPSTSDNPAALQRAVDFMADFVSARADVTIERFERNGKPSFLAYRGAERPAKFDVLLNAHLDVVPGNEEQFKVVVKNNKLYGRGALDMKGTAVVLADVFCESVAKVPYTLGLQIVSDEEVGGYNGTRLQIDEGVRANFVVMGEYANEPHTIYNAARGLAWAEIAFKGKTAHGGHLWNGRNAVVEAGEFAAAVLKHYPTPDKETWTTTASIANLSTPNDTFNKVPDSAILKIDFRFTQEDPVFGSEESLRAFIASINPDAKLIDLATFEPAVDVEELNPYVQGLSAALCKATGTKPRFRGRPGGSDGRHYALVGNDIVEFGLYGKYSHADGEYVEISSIAEYQMAMRGFLQNPTPTNVDAKPQRQEPLELQLLRKLVAIPTVSGDFAANNRALKFVADFLHERGMYVETFEQNGYRSIIATTKPGCKDPKVMFNAHVDVTPAAPELFAVAEKDGRFYGRGVMDMKMAIASYMAVVDRLKADLHRYDFGIMITSDEEVGGKNGVLALIHDKGYKPQVAIVPDGGENWQIETFTKGVQWIKLSAKGKAGHASRPWEGDSAIRHLLTALHEIESIVPASPTPKDTIISVGTIEGGTTANQIPTEASAMLDVRSGSLADHTQIVPRIEAICGKYGIRVEVLVDDPPTANDIRHPLVKPFVQILNEIVGGPQGTSYSFGTTDGRHFSAAGIPCVVVEPPSGNRHHTEEWLSRDGFLQFTHILERYVSEVAAPAVPQTEYVWYATYGTGLSREDFLLQIRGGKPKLYSADYEGCTDKSEPLKDVFMSLPYSLYFGGRCSKHSGGIGTLSSTRDAGARTIARAYLITLEQFSEVAAQMNGQPLQPLPTARAKNDGFAVIGDGGGDYSGLLYCGQKQGLPVFSLTAAAPRTPIVPPNHLYTQMLCRGLSEDRHMTAEDAVDYLLHVPGVRGAYQANDLSDYFSAVTSVDKHRTLV